MRLKSVYVRFYKSFNYDHFRKIKADEVNKKPWEFLNGQFYPYVEIAIEPQITAIVGANESGKSHLLSAIEKGLIGRSEHTRGGFEISRKDFCRYSHFFQSTIGGPQLPDFGFEWTNLKDSIKSDKLQSGFAQIKKMCGLNANRDFDRFFLFRNNGNVLTIYIPKSDGTGYDQFSVENIPTGFLPYVFRIDSQIAMPDSVPIRRLIRGRYTSEERWASGGREMAYAAVKAVPTIRGYLQNISSLPKVQGVPGTLYHMPESLLQQAATLQSAIEEPAGPWRDDELYVKAAEFNLAYDLIFTIAKIDVTDIQLLYDALQKGETGIVRSVVDNINEALRKRLNFPRIWAQDRNFALRIEATEHELSFIISDRTGRQYAFNERSSGLRHFLSYYIQYLTHKPQGRTEILLMDEPDAFLSGEAQQDLLKVFQMFADPSIGRGKEAVPVQVIYVTHSPFLIDKNHAERVRALEKSEGSKGTRVISGAAQNHYEPLRSAFGSFVGETTFISGCNLMVEGTADQILLAGTASYLRKLEAVPESQLLDLNRITIVPAGGGANVPYLVYLARGRDAEKPAVIVLLDGDDEGNAAKKDLSKDGPHPRKKQVLDEKFILQLSDIHQNDVLAIRNTMHQITDKEDAGLRPFTLLEGLIPLSLAVSATKVFLASVYGIQQGELDFMEEKAISEKDRLLGSSYQTIQNLLSKFTPSSKVHMDKVPFARTVIDLLPGLARERMNDAGQVDWQKGEANGLNEFEANMRTLFHQIREMQTRAEQDAKDRKMHQKVDEKVQTFTNDHADGGVASRDEVARLLTDIESDLEGDETERMYILGTCTRLRAAHNLNEDLTESVRDFPTLLMGLEKIRNSQDYAYANPDLLVPSLKAGRPATEPLGSDEEIIHPLSDVDVFSITADHTDATE